LKAKPNALLVIYENLTVLVAYCLQIRDLNSSKIKLNTALQHKNKRVLKSDTAHFYIPKKQFWFEYA
jgi:hypothetical protein